MPDHIVDGLPPFPSKCKPKMAILGTLPSEESLKDPQGYYKGTRNQFWKIIFSIYDSLPDDITSISPCQKEEILRKNGIILWDVLKSGQREGSRDRSIKNAEANMFDKFMEENNNPIILFNGKTARNYASKKKIPELEKYLSDSRLFSSSSAYSRKCLGEKVDDWRLKFGRDS